MKVKKTDQLARVQKHVQHLENRGLLPGAADYLEQETAEFQRATELIVVTDAVNSAVSSGADFSSDAVAVKVVESNYERFLETPELQKSDAIIFETTHGRLNKESLSQWQIALALARTDVFVGVLQSATEALDPDSFERIAEANRLDVSELSAQEIPYFTKASGLKIHLDAHELERRNNRFAGLLISLGKRARAGHRHQESLLDALIAQQKFRLKYDGVMRHRGVVHTDTPSWEGLLREKIADGTQAAVTDARKKLQQEFKTYNGGAVYERLRAYLRGQKINPRKKDEVALLESGLVGELTVNALASLEKIQREFVADVRINTESAFRDLIACISEESPLLAEIDLQTPLAAEDMKLPGVTVDERRALISKLKRVSRYLIEVISGAVLGAIGMTYIFPEPTVIAIGAVAGAVAKLVYCHYDMRDTERNALELDVERQLQGVVADTAAEVREKFEIFSKSVFADVQHHIDGAVQVIAAELAEELEGFTRMASASAEDVRVEMARVQKSIEGLSNFILDIRSMAEEPVDESEAAD